MYSNKTFGRADRQHYYEYMSLTKTDLSAIKKLFDTSLDERVPRIIDERVPKIVQPMLDKLEERLTHKIDELTLDVGQFSLETTNNFYDLERRVNDKIDEADLRLGKKIDEVDTRLGNKIDEVDHRLGDKIDEVDRKLGDKIDEVGEKVDVANDTSDANRVEVAKMKRKLGLT